MFDRSLQKQTVKEWFDGLWAMDDVDDIMSYEGWTDRGARIWF